MAAMANSPPTTLGPQPTWMPYEPTRDCSQGLCSMYCPQWCYFIFPPPPPVFDIAGPSGDGDDSSGPAFSPLVIAIIGVLASAFLLVSYYTIVSKYCGTFSSLRNRVFGSGAGGGGGGGGGDGHGDSRGQETWEVPPADGMDETLINKITVCKYKRGDGFVDSTDCSVCLGEFRDGESLRLLPKCSHAFHLPCIDTWLKSHSNCPLCRCNIAFVAVVGMVSPEPEGRAATREDRRGNRQFVLTVDDYSSGQAREEPQAVSSSNGGSNQEAKDTPGRSEAANVVIEIREDGTAPPVPVPVGATPSMPDTHRMSIADVLQESLEDELTVARESGLLQAGSSRRCHGEHSKDCSSGRAPPDAANPAPTKKLPPAGRSCFSSKSGGRGKDSAPPM